MLHHNIFEMVLLFLLWKNILKIATRNIIAENIKLKCKKSYLYFKDHSSIDRVA